MEKYKARIADKILKEKLDAMGAVLVEGPKYCGKTTLAAQQAASILSMSDPDTMEQYIAMANTNIRLLLRGDTPRLIDEWQIVPKFWDAVRNEVDRRDDDGQFILTGSSVPPSYDEIFHTGTGRFAWLKLRTMSLWESGDSTGEVSLARLFAADRAEYLVEGFNPNGLERLAYLVCRGGWPKALDKRTEKAALQQAVEYFEAVTNFDISRVDAVNRDSELARRIMRSYARHQGGQASVGTLLADIAGNESSEVSENTVYSYLKALKKIFVIEDALAWNPNLRSRVAIRTSDTRYFTDPSIATAALGMGPDDLINDLNTFGLFFETLCVRDLRVYADALGGTVYHYRDKSGAECDAVVHLRNGAYGLIEVKLGGDKQVEEGAKTLTTLASKIDTTKMKEPAFKMVITGVGLYAYQRPQDGVYVVPIGCLKD